MRKIINRKAHIRRRPHSETASVSVSKTSYAVETAKMTRTVEVIRHNFKNGDTTRGATVTEQGKPARDARKQIIGKKPIIIPKYRVQNNEPKTVRHLNAGKELVKTTGIRKAINKNPDSVPPSDVIKMPKALRKRSNLITHLRVDGHHRGVAHIKSGRAEKFNVIPDRDVTLNVRQGLRKRSGRHQ